MQASGDYKFIPTPAAQVEEVDHHDDAGSVTATDDSSVGACKSCFSGCWRMIAGGVRNVRNYCSSVHFNLCRDDSEKWGGARGDQKVISLREGASSQQASGDIFPDNAKYSKEKTNTSVKDGLELIAKFSSLFSVDYQRHLQGLDLEISRDEISSLKEGAVNSDADHITASDYGGELKAGKEKLADTLKQIEKSENVRKSGADFVPAMFKKLSGSLDCCSCEDLSKLCAMIKVPDGLIRLFNSKLLKANICKFIDEEMQDLFRKGPAESDLKKNEIHLKKNY